MNAGMTISLVSEMTVTEAESAFGVAWPDLRLKLYLDTAAYTHEGPLAPDCDPAPEMRLDRRGGVSAAISGAMTSGDARRVITKAFGLEAEIFGRGGFSSIPGDTIDHMQRHAAAWRRGFKIMFGREPVVGDFCDARLEDD
jgi:hypothetical protein